MEDCEVWQNWFESEPVKLKAEMCIDACYHQTQLLRNKKPKNSEDIPDWLLVDELPEEDKTCDTYLSSICDRDYLNQLKGMHPADRNICISWIKLLTQLFDRLKAWDERECFSKT